MELYSLNYEYIIMVLKKHIFCFLSCLFSGLILSQVDLSGNWQGIIQLDGQTIEKSSLLYANFNQKGTALDGKMRDEIVGKDFYAVKRLKATVLKNEITFNQTIIEKQKQNAQTNWCLLSGTLSYNDSSGYLIGTFKSTDCKRYTGKIILYKSTAEFSATTQSPLGLNCLHWNKLHSNCLRFLVHYRLSCLKQRETRQKTIVHLQKEVAKSSKNDAYFDTFRSTATQAKASMDLVQTYKVHLVNQYLFSFEF